MLDFHAAIRWCLPTVSQYFVSVPYSREQSSCHIKFLLGARLSCGHQVVLTCGIPVLCQYPIFTWAILLPILAVAYQGMKYHNKCIRKLCTPNCNNIIQKLDLNRKKPNRKNCILCLPLLPLPLSGLKPNSESIPAIAHTSPWETIFNGHGSPRRQLHSAAASTPVFPLPYAYHRRCSSN